MPIGADEIDRLQRLIERLLDAALLLFEEGGALLEAIDSSRQCQSQGDRKLANQRFSHLIVRLVRGGELGDHG